MHFGRRAWHFNRHGLMLRAFGSTTKSTTGFSYPGARTLEQLVKLELLKKEQTLQIRTIWNKSHADKDDAIATALNATQFHALVKRAKKAPYFIFPVYRQDGFFNILCQFHQSCFLITYLEAFKENPSAAPPCVSVSFYQRDELYDRVDKFNNKPNQFDFEHYRRLLKDITEITKTNDDMLLNVPSTEHLKRFNIVHFTISHLAVGIALIGGASSKCADWWAVVAIVNVVVGQ
ncbi:hypothetical protein PsorP6_009973 [Peronosclerospora sorghi]|uniref:Uncharacterized protein n=1 Tax=Peronosclerospora sorghi TaxID=230839 RepID=A0ACC0VV06_9STRA|nr:hypothetical protein PsorP6_009973 [Peronosclerospora sorghi]